MRWTSTILAGFCSVSLAASQDMPLSSLLVDGSDWRVVDRNYEKVMELTTDAAGNVFVNHVSGQRRIDVNGKTSVVDRESRTPATLGIQVRGWNGTYYSTGPERSAILALVPDRPADAKPLRISIPSLKSPSGVTVSPDRGTLFVGDHSSSWVWAFRIEKDGTLTAGQPYASMRVRGREPSGVVQLTTDQDGRIYALTKLGIQVFDPTGRMCGVLTVPTREPLVAMTIGGAKGNQLFLADEKTVFAREIKSRRVDSPSEKRPTRPTRSKEPQ